MSIIKKSELNQRGFASIVVALILVVVLSLITVGFVQLSRREQQNSLNQQLATQASYAAESTINRVVSALRSDFASVNPNTNCGTPDFKETLTADVKVTCVLISKNPTSSQYGGVAANNGKIMTFKTDASVGSIDFRWASSTTTNNSHLFSLMPANNPKASTWNKPAVMQLSITPLGSGKYTRSQMMDNTYNLFLYPGSNGVTSLDASVTGNGSRILVKCDAAKPTPDTCKLTINTQGSGIFASEYVVHFISLYDTSDVKISANGIPVGGTSQQLQLQNSQAEIDVTARAQDVVKRIKVRVPIDASTSGSIPDYALQANNICKRMKTSPLGSDFFNISGTKVSSADDACDALSDKPIY